MTTSDLKNNLLGRIAANINSYNKIDEIDQALPYHKLKNMNIPMIIDIYNGKVNPESKLSQNIARKSYEMMLSGENVINVPEHFVHDMLGRLERFSDDADFNVSVCSILLRVSREQVIRITDREKGIYLPQKVRTYFSAKDMSDILISSDQLGAVRIQFDQIINRIVNKGLFLPDIYPSNIIYSESKLKIYDTLESVYTVSLNCNPQPIPKGSDVELVKIFMKFQVRLATYKPLYADYEDIIADQIFDIIDFMNIPEVKRNYTEFSDLDIGIENLGILFSYASRLNKVTTSSVSSIKKEYISDLVVTRVKKKFWVGVSDNKVISVKSSDVDQLLDIPSDMTVLESINWNVFEKVYAVVYKEFEEIAEKIFNVKFGSTSPFTIISEGESIGVYLGSEETVLRLEGVDFNIAPGHIVATNLDTIYGKFDDGKFLWYY